MDGKPSQDPENSDVAKNYEKTKKVETLMNRLAEYMAGEIPEDNIKDLITGDDEEPRHSLSQKTIPLASLEPKEVFRHPSQNELEPMMLAASDDEAGRGQDLGDDDNDGEIEVENEADYLPDINVKPIPLGQRNKLKVSPKKKPAAKDDPLFIYKDFDTSLTKVGGNKNYHPPLTKTTSVRGEDLIRDRLLSFKYRNGQVSTKL